MCAIDWSLVVNCVAAVGSVGAALAALYIATRDRRERRRERADGDHAHAKLVFVSTTYTTGDDAVGFQLYFDNQCGRPILDLSVLKYTLRGAGPLTVKIPDTVEAICKAGANGRTAQVETYSADGRRYPAPTLKATDYPSRWNVLGAVKPYGWLGFTDLNGNRWARSSDGELRRIRHREDVDRLPIPQG